MKTPLFFFPLLGLCLLVACGDADPAPDAEPPAPDISTALLGTWETIEIEVESPTYQGSDSTIHDHIREADWGRRYGVRPARTVYIADGKLRRTHRLVTGQVADVTHGLWKPEGDSLFVIEPSITYRYAYDITDDYLTLSGMVDYDQDGERDDRYRARLRLVGRTAE